jgi:primosomal protein N''
MKRHLKNLKAVIFGKFAPYALRLFIFVVCLTGFFVYVFAEGNEPVSLNDAVDDGQVRIVQSRSSGGYSRFTMEMENTSNKPVSVDPYGSAFDPPWGVATQRVGIGLPIKIGDNRIDMRKSLSTDPSREAPVGSQADQNSSGTIPDEALPAAAGAAAATAAVGAFLTGMAQGVRPREALGDLAELIRGGAETIPPDAQGVSDFEYQTGIIKSYRDQDMTELDYQKQRLDAAKAQGASDVVRGAQEAIGRLSGQVASYDRNLAELGQKPLEHTQMEKRSFDYTREDLGVAVTEAKQNLEDLRETGKYVDMSNQLADNFGTDEEKAWCRDYISRHAKIGADGYEIDPETARQMYSGLKKQMYESGQILNEAESEYQTAAAEEIGRKTEVVKQIRDNATRVNRVLAKFDPTGTGSKIVGLQQSAYGAIDGYEKGGIAGAAESAALSVADNYTQGYASGNYNALKDAYAEQGISDESVAARLAKANYETANNKYNVLDHVGKAANNVLEGEYGAAFDSTMDAVDAKDSLKEDYGKTRDWATGAKADTPDKPPVPQADEVPDAAPDGGKKSLGTMRRESFEKTRASFDNETKMMQELNRVADIPDADQKAAELVKVRNSDPSTFNVVQKQLHPETAAEITKTNADLSDKIVTRQAQILKDQGYDSSVRLTGKAGGADTDGYWTIKDSDGKVLSDGETKKLAGDALKKASDDVLKPLGTDADQMGHKIMNDSPEKFSADPNDLGIKSRDGRLEDGNLVFDDHEKTGDHWKTDPREAALTAPKDRIADAAMTKDNAESLGDVLKTKTEHLDEIARNKGAVGESDMRDMARELTKTNNRTFAPMAEKAGLKPTAEYRDLMQKLALVKDGDISSDHLPPVKEIDRIIAENVGMLKDSIKD